jgi:hypothetical protein
MARAQTVGQIIVKTRLTSSLPALSGKEFELAVAAWNEILENIHVDWLDECYKRAMKAHKATEPFKAVEILDIWKAVTANGDYEQWQANRRIEAAPCTVCTNTGWMRYDENGNQIPFADEAPGSRVARCVCGR